MHIDCIESRQWAAIWTIPAVSICQLSVWEGLWHVWGIYWKCGKQMFGSKIIKLIVRNSSTQFPRLKTKWKQQCLKIAVSLKKSLQWTITNKSWSFKPVINSMRQSFEKKWFVQFLWKTDIPVIKKTNTINIS